MCPPDSKCGRILSACLIPGAQLKIKEQVGEGDLICPLFAAHF